MCSPVPGFHIDEDFRAEGHTPRRTFIIITSRQALTSLSPGWSWTPLLHEETLRIWGKGPAEECEYEVEIYRKQQDCVGGVALGMEEERERGISSLLVSS